MSSSPTASSLAHQKLLAALQEYATAQLQKRQEEVIAALQRRGVAASQIQPLVESYGIILKVGDRIALKPIYNRIRAQIAAAAEFIRDFHISVLGQDTGAFHVKEVEIRIERGWRKLFLFNAGKLLIRLPDYAGIPFLFGGFSYVEMQQLWQQGNPIFHQLRAKIVWQIINPTGHWRSSLRSTLHLAATKQILGADKILAKFGFIPSKETADRGKEPQDFKATAIAYLRSAQADKLGINLELLLQECSDAQVAQLLALWQKYLHDPQQREALIQAGALTLQSEIAREQSKVDVKMWGFVNVGNYHRIDVAVNISAGYLSKYIEVLPRETQVKAIQFGFVNVYTIDDITVKPSFHGAIAIRWEAAALERAWQELQLLK